MYLVYNWHDSLTSLSLTKLTIYSVRMHVLAVKKTNICFELRIEQWTVYSSREVKDHYHDLSVSCIPVHLSSNYNLSGNSWFMSCCFYPIKCLIVDMKKSMSLACDNILLYKVDVGEEMRGLSSRTDITLKLYCKCKQPLPWQFA